MPGLHRESKSDLLTEMFDFFDSHGYERKRILIRNMVLGLVPTPAKHVLLVHINISLGQNIHQGLKIIYSFTHKQINYQIVNVNPRYLSWQRRYLQSMRSLVRTWTLLKKRTCIFGLTRFGNCLNFQNARAIHL